MKKTLLIGLMGILAVNSFAAANWKPVPGNLMTEWAARVNPSKPLPEYPRPQMQRKDWINLNGLWEYAITDQEAGKPAAYEGLILVPFPIESALSGVKKPLSARQRLWYRHSFSAPKFAASKRLFLHFGAVDWEAQIWLNGRELGLHRGGYDSFSFDVTDHIKPGAQNELVVSVFDETGGIQPKGKQNFNAITRPGGIMYTPCSGIWQTVWLEMVPASHIESIVITPDLDQSTVAIRVLASGVAQNNKVKLTVLDESKTVAKGEGLADENVVLKLTKPKLWSPDSPFLYGLKIQMGEDEVRSYFGMRKISLGQDGKGITRLLLNGKFIFQSGPLDQGYWPDGVYTAPTDDALRYDVEITRKLGFNMTRKHVKIEPARWYYWCDKLGLLVWQDMPSAGAGKGGTREKEGAAVSPEANAQFERELRALVEQHRNHPSIIMWIVFNEGWGQYDTPRLTKLVKELDPSRLASNASGWHDRAVGDIIDMHAYPGPNSPKPEPMRAAVLGEFGGLGLAVMNHTWVEKTWGYRGMPDARTLTRKYCELWGKAWNLKDDPGLCAAVYTQITDVETECNGLLTYDRKVVKVDLKAAADAAARNILPPIPQYKVILPSAREGAAQWRYTTEKPAELWFDSSFNDSAWKSGQGGFGMPNSGQVRAGEVGTQWNTADIWMRREFTLPEGKVRAPMLRVFHDEDCEIYLNGVLAATGKNYLRDYEEMVITKEAIATLKPGRNVIAIHCHQQTGGQFIDAGLVDELP